MSQVKTITELFDYLPHRYPFLLLDRVTEIVKGEYIRGYKNITFNEEMFSGHFPGQPIMPGVLILEAMAQFLVCWRSKLRARDPPMVAIIYSEAWTKHVFASPWCLAIS